MKMIRSIRYILLGLKRNITLIQELFTTLTLFLGQKTYKVSPLWKVNFIWRTWNQSL